MKISIITVCLNSERTIEQTIQSVIGQDYDDYEYIVIDGGSTDETIRILNKYKKYISTIISELDEGIYDAMNKGIRHATGDIIAFLNSDDWYEPGALKKVAEYFADVKTDMLFGCVYYIKNGKIECKVKPDLSKINTSMPCCHQAIFSRRELFERVGLYDIKYSVSADYDWVVRAYNSGANIMCVQDTLANYRFGGCSNRQEYRLHAEAAQIAMKNAENNRMVLLATEIQKDWEDWKKMFYFHQACEHDLDYIRNLLNMQADYYIWGTGFYGRECYRLFSLLQIRIKGFIDNYDGKSYLEGYPVIRPSKIKDEGLICIAAIRYEDEIISQLRKMGVKPDRYILFSALRDKVAAYEQEKDDWEIKEH